MLNQDVSTRARVRVAALACVGAFVLLSAACTSLAGRLPVDRFADDAPLPVDVQLLAPDSEGGEAAHYLAVAQAVIDADPALSGTVSLGRLTPQLLSRLQRGRPLDDVDLLVLNTASVPALVDQGMLAPLPAAEMGLDALDARLVRAVTVNGQLYCAPLSMRTLALFYNKSLFAEAGAPPPTDAWRWADLRAAATVVDSLPTVKFTPFGVVLTPDLIHWLPFALQAGDDGQLRNRRAVEESLIFVRDLYSDTLAITPGYYASSWSGPVFGNGRVGMTVEGDWLADYLAVEFPDLTYGIELLPAGSAGRGTLLLGECVAVVESSGAREVAGRIAAALSGESAAQARLAISTALPARPALWPAWQARHPERIGLTQQLPAATLWQGAAADQATIDAVNAGLRGLIEGDITPAELAARLADRDGE